VRRKGAQAAAEAQALKERQEMLAAAKPKLSLLHHIAATQAMQIGFTILLLNGGSYKTDKSDFIFTDGLSILKEGHRIYIQTAVKAIRIHNPGEA
jgi:hypothetical protein